MTDPFASLSEETREKLRGRSQPQWQSPMLARLTHETFSDDAWIFERKLDGERALAFRHGGAVRLLSRNRNRINSAYPEIVEALEKQKTEDFIVDGEIVAFEGNVTSFARLQHRMQLEDPDEARRTGVAVWYYVFDLLYCAGHDTTHLPLRERKSLLRKVITFRDPLRFTRHRNGSGQEYFKQACKKHWEGLIAKRADSTYEHGRSGNWLKFKCSNQQEFVIGGFTDPQGSRKHFGALLVGFYDGGDLRYAGKVGTGFDEDTLRRLGKHLHSRERKTCPFDEGEPSTKGVHWVKPDLVGEFAFTEWTDDDRLRHPRFLGLRRDKAARKVTKEA